MTDNIKAVQELYVTKSFVAVLILVLFPVRGLAQNPTSAAASSGVVGRMTRMVEHAQWQGPTTVDFRHLSFATKLRPVQTQPQTRGGHPVLIGAAVGAGAGYVLNATACRTGESVCTPPGNLLMAGIGAGVGALVGALIARR